MNLESIPPPIKFPILKHDVLFEQCPLVVSVFVFCPIQSFKKIIQWFSYGHICNSPVVNIQLKETKKSQMDNFN